ncbi:MAG TPA: ROK family protein [Polyangiaceae bacterium]|nr:ROK family protein [Polyangiaceae bacterium]
MIGVDFGGTQIKAGIVEGGEILRSHSVPTGAGLAPSAVLDRIALAVHALDEQPSAVGLVIPGEVDATGRCWRLPNVPGFEGVPIASELSARVRCPVVVENDATAAALGELLHGHGQRFPSFVLFTLGTGVGGGVVIDGRVRRGQYGFAGELGHIMLDRSADAWLCNCGLRGCLEAYAGTKALLRRYSELGGVASEVRDIALAARRGERTGLEPFEMMGRALGQAVAGIQNLLDLDAIVFSGGISASFDLIEPSLRQALQERAFAPPLATIPLLVSELSDKAGVIGAAHLTRLRQSLPAADRESRSSSA